MGFESWESLIQPYAKICPSNASITALEDGQFSTNQAAKSILADTISTPISSEAAIVPKRSYNGHSFVRMSLATYAKLPLAITSYVMKESVSKKDMPNIDSLKSAPTPMGLFYEAEDTLRAGYPPKNEDDCIPPPFGLPASQILPKYMEEYLLSGLISPSEAEKDLCNDKPLLQWTQSVLDKLAAVHKLNDECLHHETNQLQIRKTDLISDGALVTGQPYSKGETVMTLYRFTSYEYLRSRKEFDFNRVRIGNNTVSLPVSKHFLRLSQFCHPLDRIERIRNISLRTTYELLHSLVRIEQDRFRAEKQT